MRISDCSSDVCSSDLLASIGSAANLCNRADAGKLGHLVHATNSFTALALPSAGCGPGADKIGRASCRESVCPYVSISVVAVSLQRKHTITSFHADVYRTCLLRITKL